VNILEVISISNMPRFARVVIPHCPHHIIIEEFGFSVNDDFNSISSRQVDLILFSAFTIILQKSLGCPEPN